MYDRYVGAKGTPVAAINGDFFLLSSANTTGHPQINNRPYGMEVVNGMMGQTPFQWTNGVVFTDNTVAHGTVSFSGTATAGGKTFPIAEVNGYAGEGQLTLFNGLSNSYGSSDDAHAWSPYSSTMVSLSQPQEGWRTNGTMTFTVTGVTQNTTAKDLSGIAAMLVGSSSGSPDQTLGISTSPDGPNQMSWSNKGSYYEITTTGGDPYCYLSGLNPSISGAANASFSFEYQSASEIPDMEIFYGKPLASGGVSTTGQRLSNTGLNASEESRWRTFTIDLKPAINNFQWGHTGHTLRLDIGGSAGHHVYIRNMRITGSASGADSRAFLNSLTTGQQVNLRLNVSLNGVQQIDPYLNVVGFQNVILQNGVSINTWPSAEPRTVMGYSQDGRKVYLVVVDGRSGSSAGVTTGQAADIIKALGAHTAVNLDGGGSSCMVVNVNGSRTVVNSPSDGSPRRVANGIVVVKK
jgi:hypothetical protein